MKRITFAVIALALAWYMGGCGGASDQVSAPSISDLSTFAGTYNLKDHNCDSTIFSSFRVNRSETSMTILDNGGSQIIRNGDIIILDRDTDENGKRFIHTRGLRCTASFAENASQAVNINRAINIDVSANDLFALCFGESTDDICYLSFTRSSIN